MKSSKNSRKRVSKKIEYLIGEGKSPDQAVAMALSMEREGRLSESGAYIPVKKKIKKASAENKEDKHLVHFIMNGNELEYIEEFDVDTAKSAADAVKNYANNAKSKPSAGSNENYVLVIAKESRASVFNVFLLRGFSKEELQEIKNILNI